MRYLLEFFTRCEIKISPYPIAEGEPEYGVKRAILSKIKNRYQKRCQEAVPERKLGHGTPRSKT
jgi:hypothetical protein